MGVARWSTLCTRRPYRSEISETPDLAGLITAAPIERPRSRAMSACNDPIAGQSEAGMTTTSTMPVFNRAHVE